MYARRWVFSLVLFTFACCRSHFTGGLVDWWTVRQKFTDRRWDTLICCVLQIPKHTYVSAVSINRVIRNQGSAGAGYTLDESRSVNPIVTQRLILGDIKRIYPAQTITPLSHRTKDDATTAHLHESPASGESAKYDRAAF